MKKLIYLTSIVLLLLACDKEKQDNIESTFSELTEMANIGDTIILKGENFPTDTSQISIYFDNQKSKIIALSTTSISLKVPIIKTKTSSVNIKINNQGTKSFPFKLADVKITSASAEIKLSTFTKIYGKNLQSLLTPQLIINDVVTPINQISDDGLSFKLPDILYPNRKINVEIKDVSLSKALTFVATTTDKWIRVAYSPFVKRGEFDAFTFKGDGFIFGNNTEGAKKETFFYKLNPATYAYTKYPLPVDAKTAFATPSHIYYALNKINIYEYDLLTQKSTFLTNSPDSSKYSTFLTIGEDIYCFSSPDFTPLKPQVPIYFLKYDFSTQTWVNKKPLINATSIGHKLAVNGTDVYVLINNTQLAKYNSLTDSWSYPKSSISFNSNGTVNLSALYANDNKLYALYYYNNIEYMYEYSISSATWKNLGTIVSANTANYFGFFIGNKHFIGGNKHNTLSSDLFESDVNHIFLF